MLKGRALRRPNARWLLLVFGVWLAPSGQTLHAERLPVRTYGTADGLAHDAVNRVVRDSRGFLWFCTDGGLSRFDGYAFTNFGTEQGLPQSAVTDFLESRSGEYWIGTRGGLVHFHPGGPPARRIVPDGATPGSAPMFTVIASDDDDRIASVINVLLEGRDGTIWIGTNKGVQRLEQTHGRWVLRTVDIGIGTGNPEQSIVYDVVEDAGGSLWAATPDGLYRRWPDGSSAHYTERDGLPNQYLQDLFIDHEGRLWVSTRLNGFFRLDVDATHRAPRVDRRFTDTSREPSGYGLPASWVNQLFEGADHRFWIATARGLVEYFPEADPPNRFRAYRESNGFSNDIVAIAEDLGGNLWMGTAAAGAMKLTRGGFTTFGRLDGIEYVAALFEDRTGDLCVKAGVFGDPRTSRFGSRAVDGQPESEPDLWSRLGCFDGRRFDWFTPAALTPLDWDPGWVQEEVTLRSRGGEWWIGTGSGLLRYAPIDRLTRIRTDPPLAAYTTRDGLAAPQVFRLFEDSRNSIWVSTTSTPTRGLARWDPADGRLHDLAGVPGLPSFVDNLPRAFGEDAAGSVWIGFTGALARYQQGRFTYFTARDGVPPGRIVNIYRDHTGRLWLASDTSGLVRVDATEDARPRFTALATADGLASNDAEVIVEDAAGHLYVGGGRGLDRFDPSTGHVKHFTAADGLPTGILKAAFRDRHDELWFGLSSGLAHLAPVSAMPDPPPPVLITGLRIGGASQFVSALGERAMTLADLPSGGSQLQIDFVGLGFGPGEALRYQYKLDGADRIWSDLSEQRTVTYASLAPGQYTFVVRAVNSEGTASPEPAEIRFRILAPIWRRWWFLTLATLAVGLIAGAAYRARMTRLLEIANMRTRIATDLHDDIGANLTRIALLSEVAQRVPAGSAVSDAEGPLASIARIARESVGSMSDIVWTINPGRDTLQDVIRRMRRHAEEIFTLRDIDLEFDAPDPGSAKLGADLRRDLLLIFKEAVNNAARHSGCTAVAISLRLERSRLMLVIADNGAGFDTGLASEGQGLASMTRRAHRLHGTFEIRSSRGAGTTVTLSVPLRA